MRRLTFIGVGTAAVAGLLHIGLLAYMLFERIPYPFDLEWEEGGMLCHALRLLEGRSIYAPPSADFISFLYTPFYPFILAASSKVFGLSYFLGRCISSVAFLGAIFVVFCAVRRQVGKGWLGVGWGLAAAGLIASSFLHTGGWYDLVRNDSLFLALVTFGLYLLVYHYHSYRLVIVAGVMMGLAFLTKQTASVFIVFSGVALLFLNWRKLPGYVLTVGIVAGGTVLVLNYFSDGWFWRFIYEMHQNHDFYY
ncbi:MAG: glycosyltransferase family 39 protein, partial [Pseudomonadota bacterium]